MQNTLANRQLTDFKLSIGGLQPLKTVHLLQQHGAVPAPRNGGNHYDSGGKNRPAAEKERLVAGRTGGENQRIAAGGIQVGERADGTRSRKDPHARKSLRRNDGLSPQGRNGERGVLRHRNTRRPAAHARRGERVSRVGGKVVAAYRRGNVSVRFLADSARVSRRRRGSGKVRRYGEYGDARRYNNALSAYRRGGRRLYFLRL